MSGFQNIVPCGIKDFGVTSISEIVGAIDAEKFNQIVREKFEKLASSLRQ